MTVPPPPPRALERDTNIAQTTLLVLAAIGAGLAAAFIGIQFEFKIVLGLMLGLVFGTIILVRPVIGVLFFLFTIPVLKIFPPTFFGSGLLNPVNLILALITVAIALQRVFLLRTGFSDRAFARPILLYAAVLIMSMTMNLLHAHATIVDVVELMKVYLIGAYVYFLTSNVVDDPNRARKVFVICLVTVGLTALWGLYEYRTSLLGGKSAERIRLAGRVGQPNEFGGYLAMYLPFFVAMMRYKGLGNAVRLLTITGAVVTFFALLFTQSRGAYLGFACSLVFVAALVNRRLILVLVLGIATSQYWLPEQVTSRVQGTVEDGGFDGSTEKRLELYRAGVDMWKSSPIVGHGFNAFHRLSASGGYTDVRRASHSLYIQMLVETGLVGIIVLFGLFYYLFKQGWWLHQHATDPLAKTFAEGFIGCMIAVVIVNLFGVRFYNYISISYFWALVAVLNRLVQETRERSATPPDPTRT